MSEHTDIQNVDFDKSLVDMTKKQRKRLIKSYMKNRDVPVYNSDGTLQSLSNEYSETRRKEKNFNKWFDRVRRAQESGREISRLKREASINAELEKLRYTKTSKDLQEQLKDELNSITLENNTQETEK